MKSQIISFANWLLKNYQPVEADMNVRKWDSGRLGSPSFTTEELFEIYKESHQKPSCKIINDTNSWVMEVDGKTILLHNTDSAEYIGEMFASFGYEVTFDWDKWKRIEDQQI
jgi:hypothetical protein